MTSNDISTKERTMTANLQQADGTLERVGGRDLIRFERRLSHPVERVWRAITEPEEIVQWLGEAKLEPVEGGTVFLRWLNTPKRSETRGTVTVFDPPRALELDTDTHGILHWELKADGEACTLIFTASYPEKDLETRLSLLSGWHIHLDHLADALEGRPQDWPRWMDEQRPRWQEHHDHYAARFAE
jgi:uncharacterized protein YndB with AHSA1/START domain